MRGLLITALIFPILIFGQNTNNLTQDLLDEERSSLEALALYPDTIRDAILEISQHPEVLIRIEAVQSEMRERFIDLVEALPRNQQENIWNLVRFPELLELLSKQKPEKKELDNILSPYSENVRVAAKESVEKNYGILVNTHQLYQEAEHTFEKLISDYPQPAQQVFRKLVELPEVISILSENLRMTILLGNMYEKDPKKTKNAIDSLSLIVAREYAQEVEDWKNRLKEDPEVLEAFQQTAEEYAEEQGLDPYAEIPPENFEQREMVIHHYHTHIQPYPFWFAYPWWYDFPLWYPYPWWYQTGFYFDSRARIVIFGLPSFHFSYWYLHQPHHHYHYPYLTNTFVDFYYGPRRSRTGMKMAVRQWIREDQRNFLPEAWFIERENRVQRLRRLGAFEMRFRQEAPPGISRREYLRHHINRYPELREALVTPDPPVPGTARPDRMHRFRTEKRDPARPPRNEKIYPREQFRPERRPSRKAIDPRAETTDPMRPEKRTERRPETGPEKTPETPERRPARDPASTAPDVTMELPNEHQKMMNARQFHKITWELYNINSR